MALDVIKSYLVALGFTVNNTEFDKANRAIQDLGQNVQTVTSGMVRNFGSAAGLIVGSLASITSAAAAMVNQVAKADMEYSKLALRMYTTKETAKELQLVLNSMNQDLDDIAWIPELRQQYFELMNQARQMETPGDAGSQLEYIRSITFEFQRMKLEAAYAIQWITYYLAKYLSGPLGDIKKSLKEFNDMIAASMPEWTNKVAKWLTMMINLGKAGVKFIVDLVSGFKSLFDMLPSGMKAFIAAMALLGAAVMSGPFGWFVLTLGAILVLLEDFYGYLEGRRSSKTLAPMWEKLIQFGKEAKAWKDEVLPDIIKKIDQLRQTVSDLNTQALKTTYEWLKVIFSELADSVKKNGVLEAFTSMAKDMANALDSIFKGLINIGKQMEIIPKNTSFKSFWKWFFDELSREFKILTAFGKALAAILDMIGLVMQGKYKEAAARGASIFPNLIKDINNANAGGKGHGTTKTRESSNRYSARNVSFDGDIEQYISEASRTYGVSADLIRSVIQKESSGNPNAVSPAGAIGLMQLMPDTAAYLGVDPWDPRQNVMGGTKYLKEQLDTFGGDVSLALAAYNAGPGAVQKYGGIPPYAETQDYVATIMGSGGYSPANSLRGSKSYASSGSYTVHLNIGDINVTVPPNSNPQQYYAAVYKAIEDKYGIRTAMETREASGVFG